MITLALDCSTGTGSIALKRDEQIWQQLVLAQGTQAAEIVPMIKQLCAEAGCEAKDIRRILCPVGPGSFTGIRISLTVARILSFTNEAEAVGINTLDAFALSYSGDAPFTVATRAGKGEAYVQRYSARAPLTAEGEIALVPLDMLDNAHIGNIENCATMLDTPNMKTLLEEENRLGRTYPLEPLYVREPDADPSKPLGARE